MFDFFFNRVERWTKDLSNLWGNISICPHLNLLELPCHSPTDHILVSSFKVWANIQKPHHDLAYLLVNIGDTKEDIQYGVSLVCVSPHQARTPTMEEAVKKLAACTSNGSDWPSILVQLYEGSDHAPLPRGKRLGILSQGEEEETSRGQISQLNICQLLSTGPQVIYPSSLNGHDKPIITTLPEPLSSGKSIIANEHSYLEIDIPFKRESDTKALLIGEASVILKTTPSKSSLEPKCSLAAEVDNLLTQAMADTSSCKSKQSSLEKTATVAATMSPPHRSEVTTPPADTSSQACIGEAEGSIEDVPTNISLIAAAYSSGSINPPVDLLELQANANRAIDNMLHLKGNLNIKRQRAAWELGVLVCQIGAQESPSVNEAEAICSQVIFDTQMICSQSVQEAKTKCLVAVREAKTTRDHSIHQAEAACSKAICKTAALKVSQSITFHKEHNRFIWDLEEHAIEDETQSHHDLLSACQATLSHNPQPLRGAMATSYHLLLGQAPPSSSTVPPQKACPVEEQPSMATLPAPTPKQSPRPKRHHPSPEPTGSMPAAGRPPNPKKWEMPPWFKSLKPSQADAFLRDSDLVVEARLCFFSKHSCNFNQDRNCDLSEVFRKLAKKAGLLGTNIYEIEASWTGPEELKQANYTPWSLPKSSRFLRVVPIMESPKVMGLMGIHDPALQHFAGFTYCPW